MRNFNKFKINKKIFFFSLFTYWFGCCCPRRKIVVCLNCWRTSRPFYTPIRESAAPVTYTLCLYTFRSFTIKFLLAEDSANRRSGYIDKRNNHTFHYSLQKDHLYKNHSHKVEWTLNKLFSRGNEIQQSPNIHKYELAAVEYLFIPFFQCFSAFRLLKRKLG